MCISFACICWLSLCSLVISGCLCESVMWTRCRMPSFPLTIHHCPAVALLSPVGESDLPVLAASWRPSWVWGSAADDAALPASAQDLQAGTPDEEGGAGGSQRIQGDFPGLWLTVYKCHLCVIQYSNYFLNLPASIAFTSDIEEEMLITLHYYYYIICIDFENTLCVCELQAHVCKCA